MAYVDIQATKYNTIRFEWTQKSQSVADNSSIVNWTMTLISGQYGYISSSSSKAWSVTVNGATVSGSNTIGISANSSKELASGSTTIKHNADGTKTFSFSFSQQFDITFNGSWVGTKSGNGTGTLTTIPRASSISCAASANIGSSITINIGRASSNFTHTLTYGFGSLSGTIATKTASTSVSWTIPDNFYTAIPNSKSGICVISCSTYNGNTLIGSNICKFTAQTVEANCNPTLSPTLEDTSNNSINLSGNKNKMIKYYNWIAYTIGAAARKSATIKSVSLINAGNKYTQASGILNRRTEDNVFIFSAIDSRGYTTTKTITMPMVDYIPLTANSEAEIALDTSTTSKATLKISGKYWSGNFGATTNTLQVKYRYNTTGDEFTEADWKTTTATIDTANNTYSATVAISGLNYKDTVYVQGWVKDKTDPIETQTYVLRTIPVFDWSDTDFNFNVPITFEGKQIDFPVEQGTKDGWTYRNWNSGIGECWKIVTVNTTITGAWGAMYVGDTKMARQNYPFPFKSKPVEIANLMNGTNAAWLFPESSGNGVNGAYSSAIYNVCRPSQVTSSQTFYIMLYAKGELQ